MEKRVKSLSVGKIILHELVFGPIGATKYNSLRADDVSRGRAAVGGWIAGHLGNLTLGVTSLIDNRTYG